MLNAVSQILRNYLDLRDALPNLWPLLPTDRRAPIQPTSYLEDHPWAVVPLKQVFHLAVTGFSLLHPSVKQKRDAYEPVAEEQTPVVDDVIAPLAPVVDTPAPVVAASEQIIGSASCLGCGATDTPEWRRGPLGPRTLCNACVSPLNHWDAQSLNDSLFRASYSPN